MSRSRDRLATALGWAMLLLLSFALGVFLSARLAWLRPVAELQLKNNGTETLSALEVQVHTAGLTSNTALPPLAPGGSLSMRFHVAGEGGLQIRRQGDAKALHSQYVEAGSRLAISLP